MTLPQKFPTQPPSAIATYDYIDIATGTGHVTFYGSGSWTSAGLSTYLIQQAFFGNGTLVEGTSTLDLSPFNFPSTVKGIAYVSFYLNKSAAGGHTVTMKFQKVSDTTTDISSAIISRTLSAAATTQETLVIPLTETHFKRGDILRLEVVISAGAGTATIEVTPTGAEPMILSIPFRTEL